MSAQHIPFHVRALFVKFLEARACGVTSADYDVDTVNSALDAFKTACRESGIGMGYAWDVIMHGPRKTYWSDIRAYRRRLEVERILREKEAAKLPVVTGNLPYRVI